MVIIQYNVNKKYFCGQPQKLFAHLANVIVQTGCTSEVRRDYLNEISKQSSLEAATINSQQSVTFNYYEIALLSIEKKIESTNRALIKAVVFCECSRKSKNCIDWAKEYLKTNLENLSVEHEGVMVKIASVTECNGDAELNQRKGKLIPIYDLVIDLTWSGTGVDGTEFTGNIKIPELLQGSESDCEKDSIKQVIRKHLTPLLIEKFKNIGKDMVETHSKDVYIEPSQLGAPNQKPITPSEPIAIEMQTSADQIYETLLDPGRVTAWTRSRPDIFRLVGSKFSLFDGNVTGTILELVPNEKIVQTWRLRTWPKDHFSTVTLRFEQTSDNTMVHLTQEGIPIGEVDIVRRNWQNYYWNSIKSVFGYDIFLKINSSKSFYNNRNNKMIMVMGNNVFIVGAMVIVNKPTLLDLKTIEDEPTIYDLPISPLYGVITAPCVTPSKNQNDKHYFTMSRRTYDPFKGRYTSMDIPCFYDPDNGRHG
ncbi:633_t:CDS:10, partial [Entrophospora sp. SA101]